MKMTKVFAVLAMALLLSANVFAGDVGDVSGSGNNIGIGLDNTSTNTNTNTATGGNANSNATATGGNANASVGNIGINAGSNVSINNPRQFLGAPGFVGGIIPGTVENNREWKLYCPTVGTFSADKIHRMERKFRFGDMFDWKRRLQVTEIEEPGDPAESLTCQMVWPATYDGVAAEVWVGGDTNSTQAEAVGTAMAACVDRGFTSIAMIVSEKVEGATSGKSLGLSGAASTVSNDTGVAYVGGGMIGTNRTRNDEYKLVRAMCLNGTVYSPPVKVEEKTPPPVVEKPVTPATQSAPVPGPVVKQADPRATNGTINIYNISTTQAPVASPVLSVPPPAKVVEPPCPSCNADEIRLQIDEVEKAIEGCKFWSRDNLDHRAWAQYLYAQLFSCTGKTDKSLLEKSLYHAGKAQQNYDEVNNPTNPRIISKKNWDENHALDVLGMVYWNQAAVVREANGREAEIAFAHEKGLEWMPEGVAEIKNPNVK